MSDAPYPEAIKAFPNEGELPGLRQSLLSDFDNCALGARFTMLYEDGWDAHPQARGTTFHRFAAKALQEMATHGEDGIEVDVALAILMECLRQADVPPEEVLTIPMSQVADLYWTVKKWAYDNSFSIANLVDVEKRLSATVGYPHPDGGTYERTISGQLDALFVEGDDLDHAIVLDWKDTWSLPPETEISFDGFFQQRFYAYLVMKNYDSIQQVTLREFYVRYSEPREAHVWRHDLEDIEAEVSALCERFDRAYHGEVVAREEALANPEAKPTHEGVVQHDPAKFYRPSPGKHCQWCARPTACPIFPSARKEGRVTSDEEAAKVAAQVVVAEAALKQAKAALRTWAEGHGPVPIKDAKGKRVYGFQETTRTERPTKEQLEEALRVGANPLDLYTTKPSTRFAQHIPKPPEKLDPEDLHPFLDAAEEGNGRAA